MDGIAEHRDVPDPGLGESDEQRIAGRVVTDLGDELDRRAVHRGRDGDPPGDPVRYAGAAVSAQVR